MYEDGAVVKIQSRCRFGDGRIGRIKGRRYGLLRVWYLEPLPESGKKDRVMDLYLPWELAPVVELHDVLRIEGPMPSDHHERWENAKDEREERLRSALGACFDKMNEREGGRLTVPTPVLVPREPPSMRNPWEDHNP